MTEETEQEAEEVEPDIELTLDAPDRVAYSELVEEFGEALILEDIGQVMKQRVRSLYDNQNEIRQRIAQAQGGNQR